MTRMREIGVNTWVWTSPLTDADVGALLRRIAGMGFDAVELPLENAGDLSVPVVSEVLAATGLTPYVVGAMAPGRDLVDASREECSLEPQNSFWLEGLALASRSFRARRPRSVRSTLPVSACSANSSASSSD